MFNWLKSRAAIIGLALGIIAPAWAITGAQELLLFGGGSKVAASVVFTLPDGATGTGIACKTFASCFSSSRASNATMTDSTGAVTFGPNNLITNSGNIGAQWSAANGSISGQTITLLSGGGYAISYLLSVSPNTNYIFTVPISGSGITSVILRPLTSGLSAIATKSVSVTSTQTTQFILFNSGSNTSMYLSLDNRGAVGGAGQAGTMMLGNISFSAVTYETAPRAVDQVVTTSTPYYGPRFDYTGGSLAGLLEEPARTNLFLNSGSPATQTITVSNATAYCVSFYGTGSITLSGALTQVLTGTGANVRTTYCGTTATTSLVATVAGSITWPQVEAGAYPTSPILTGAASTGRAVDIPAAAGPLASALAAGPSMWEFEDEATKMISRTAYAAGAFPAPVGKWYRLGCAYKPGVSLGYATARAALPNGSGC